MIPMNFHKIQPVKPDDFILDGVLWTEKERTPKLFQEYTKEEKICVLRKKILAVTSKKTGWSQKRTSRKDVESMWDVDLSKAEQGHFDQRGNFTLEEPTPPSFLWLIKRNEGISGPFTTEEMRSKINSGGLSGTLIRRDIDKGWVPYNDIIQDLGDFLESDKLDGYFEEKAIVKKIVQKQPEFFDDLSSMSLKAHPMRDMDRPKILERCIKTRNFLHSKNPSVSLNSLEPRISGKSFSDATVVVSKITGLRRVECEEFLNLLLDESKLPIFSDISPDGFIKVPSRTKKNRK